MHQMGADMTEGTIVRWLKKEGEAVERGEIIAEIETDKANVEIEAFESGVFRKVLVGEGETVSIGTVIAVIASPEEDLSQYEGVAVAAKPAVAAAAAPAPTNGRVRASPVARKLAQEKGIDLAQLRGSGPDGRIVRRDVEAAIERGPAAPAGAPAPSMPAAAGPPQVVPMS